MTDLHIDPRDHLRIFKGGSLVAEIAVGVVDSAADLEAEVAAARASRAAVTTARAALVAVSNPRDIADHMVPIEQRATVIAQGLLAGLIDAPADDLFQGRGEHGIAYSFGRDLGAALRRVAAIGQESDHA